MVSGVGTLYVFVFCVVLCCVVTREVVRGMYRTEYVPAPGVLVGRYFFYEATRATETRGNCLLAASIATKLTQKEGLPADQPLSHRTECTRDVC